MKAKSAQKTEHTYVQILSRNQENGLKQKKKRRSFNWSNIFNPQPRMDVFETCIFKISKWLKKSRIQLLLTEMN